MALRGVHHRVREQNVVHLGDRLGTRVLDDLADHEILEIPVVAREGRCRHPVALPEKRASEMTRCWISEVPSKILVSRASRQ